MMNSRERFEAALSCKPLDRPPVWIMRQAGRYLPEYRALKERHPFVEMVRTPELATEVTLQPLRRFPLDAAIIFSDILIIPEALGQSYSFREEGGIAMAFALDSTSQIKALQTERVRERLAYVPAALKLVGQELRGETALLGFAGSPWTLATYMVEGGSSKDFSKAKALYFGDPAAFALLMERLVDAVVTLCQMKIEAGVTALQIFDSWAAACPGEHYEEMSLKWIRQVIDRLPKDFPVILYAKGMAHYAKELCSTGARALGIDWTVELGAFRDQLAPDRAVQGNLDPTVLELEPSIVRTQATALLQRMHKKPGYIFNLGHGITPRARVESVAELVQTVRDYR